MAGFRLPDQKPPPPPKPSPPAQPTRERLWSVSLDKVPKGYEAVVTRNGVETRISPSPGPVDVVANEIRKALGGLLRGP